jgi:hypothetical protein
MKLSLIATMVFVTLSALLWTPALLGMHADSNGFQAYALKWYNNDAVFAGTVWIIRSVLGLADLDAIHAPRIARCVVVGALLLAVVIQARRLRGDLSDLVQRSLFVLATMFFLIPAQFPWYYLWMLPLLAATPRASLLAYAAFLPLYYVHYELPWVVWIEHVPILAWFVGETWASRRRATVATATVEGG